MDKYRKVGTAYKNYIKNVYATLRKDNVEFIEQVCVLGYVFRLTLFWHVSHSLETSGCVPERTCKDWLEALLY